MLFIENGKTEFKVAYQSANSAAAYAANELKKYVEVCTGATMSVVATDCLLGGKTFYVGVFKDEESKETVKKTDFNGDGFILEIGENEIFLNAKVNRGLIFGVYRFLETFFGVRFFNMDCEKTPFTKTVELPVKTIFEKPDFAMRSYLNGKMLAGRGEAYDIYHLKQKMCNEHRHLPEELGGECLMYGRGGTHNMCNFVPKEIYFETHPEFYAVCKRFTTIDLLNGITDDGKLDESMDVSVLKIVIEEMKKDIIAYPDAVYFQFEQEDGATYKTYEEGSHEAEILEKYGRSGILVRFCNVLATELQKWADKELNGRKIYIVTFAYSYARKPPVIEKDGKLVPIDDTVVAVDNLLFRMAFFANSAYNYFDERQVEIKGLIQGWRVVAKRFFFWAYDTDYTTFLWYYPTLRHIKSNVEGFKDMGVEYLMMQSSSAGTLEWQGELKCYIYGRLMWDSTLSVNELYNEYLENYFGPAATAVKRSMAIMENYSTFVDSVYDNYIVDTFKWTYRHADLQNEALIDRVLAILEEAETAIQALPAAEAEVYSNRLANVKVTFYHMKLNAVHHQLYKNIDKSGVRQFSEMEELPPLRKQCFYNVEMQYNVVVPVIIPDDVQEKIRGLDVMSISDELDLEGDFSAKVQVDEVKSNMSDMDDFVL